MREQIRRILGLVAAGRLSQEDAAPLLAALNPRLALSPETLGHLIGLLAAEDFGVERVTDLLMVRVAGTYSQVGGRQSQSQSQGGQGQPSQGQWPGFDDIGRHVDDIGRHVGAAVDEAMSGLRGSLAGLGVPGRPPRPGTILRIETEDENGGSFSANLPLSLAAHAERLIPPHAQKALERGGLTLDALKLLLQAGPPPGPLLEAEDEDGNSVTLSVR